MRPSMAGGWPHPDTEARYLILAVGAGAGPLAAILFLVDDVVLAGLAVVLLLLYAASHGGVVHRVSPRLALGGTLLFAAASVFLLVGRATAATLLVQLAGVAAWLGVGLWAATQWFDNRRTAGLAGLGWVASFLGLVTYAAGPILGAVEVATGFAATWPGGLAFWGWVFVPWRLAFLLTLTWFVGTGAWLFAAHAKEHRAAMAAADGGA